MGRQYNKIEKRRRRQRHLRRKRDGRKTGAKAVKSAPEA